METSIIGIGDWTGLAPNVQEAASRGYGVGLVPAPVAQPAPPDDAPTFRSSVTAVDPLWLLAAAVLLYLVLRK